MFEGKSVIFLWQQKLKTLVFLVRIRLYLFKNEHHLLKF